MRELNLIARFPLGVYLGHRGQGLLDRLPSPARLHAALLNSAGQGTTAVRGEQGLEPSEAALAALTWLEHNPPIGIMEPEHRWVDTSSRRFAYREVSSINTNRRTEERRVSDGVAVAEPVGYRWHDVPEDVAETIETLCEDVSCLGEASSIVILEPGDVRPTIKLDPEGSAFDTNGLLVDIPTSGRTKELLGLHEGAYPRKKLTLTADNFSRSEKPKSHQPTQRCVTEAFYQRADKSTSSQAPWDRVLLLAVEGEVIEPRDRAAFCLATHRALISSIGAGASGMITGKYVDGMVPPANRLAIQYLPPQYVRHHGIESGVLALMIPSDALSEDLEQLATGLAGMKQVWNRTVGRRRVTFTGTGLKAEEFWEKPEKGTVRLWRPQPVVVSEVRPPRRQEAPAGWSLADSGLLSLAFVWRSQLTAQGRGMALYSALQQQVADRGAFITDARTIGTRATNYVHRTPKDVTAQIWTGTFYLGDLADDRTLVAVGQSRHLGGGLLTPVDVPEEVFEAMKQQARSHR